MSKLKITLLGSGPAVAIPRLGHTDLICEDAKKKNSKTRRMRSSILINYKKINILIDAGPDFLKQIKNFKGKLNAVFLTHEHFDAVSGLYDLNNWLRFYKNSSKLYCLKETWQKISNHPFSNLDTTLIKPNDTTEIGDVAVTPFLVNHGVRHDVPTLGFKVSVSQNTATPTTSDKQKNDSFVYASDMDGAPKESLKYFKNAPLVIADSALWFGKTMNGHFNPEQALKFLKLLNPKKVILTQIGHSWPPYEVAIKELNYFCQNNKINFPVKVAYDGLIVTI